MGCEGESKGEGEGKGTGEGKKFGRKLAGFFTEITAGTFGHLTFIHSNCSLSISA